MNNHASIDAGCVVVGEYTDEGEVPEALAHLENGGPSNSEVERPRIVANYLDLWSRDGSKKSSRFCSPISESSPFADTP